MKSLSSSAAALFHRTDQLKSDSAERRRAWDQVIAEHQKPLAPPSDSGRITLTES
jgi:hypothetical protein